MSTLDSLLFELEKTAVSPSWISGKLGGMANKLKTMPPAPGVAARADSSLTRYFHRQAPLHKTLNTQQANVSRLSARPTNPNYQKAQTAANYTQSKLQAYANGLERVQNASMQKMAAFFDELEKISDVNLSGVSPQTILEAGAPPAPMDSQGSAKARQILDRVEAVKLAMRVKNDPDNQYMRGRAIVRPVLAGTSSGLLLASLATHKPLTTHHKLTAAGVGAGVGLADHLYMNSKTHQKHELERQKTLAKTAAVMVTPAMRLKAARQVGRAEAGIRTSIGPRSLAAVVPGR